MNYQMPTYNNSCHGSSFAFARPPPEQNNYYARPTAPYETDVNRFHNNSNQQQSVYAPASSNTQAPTPSNGDLMDFLDSSPPPPVQQAPTSGTMIDLLDTPANVHMYNNATAVPQQITVPATTLATVEPLEEEESGIAPDLVESQQRILDEIHRKHVMSQSDHALALSLSSPDGRYQQALYDSETRIVPRQLAMVPIPDNLSGSDAVHPYKKQMKQVRPFKTAVGAASGAVVGGLIMAPVAPLGVLLGGVAGGMATRKVCKSGEKRAQRKWEQTSFQRGAEQSPVAIHSLQQEGTGLV